MDVPLPISHVDAVMDLLLESLIVMTDAPNAPVFAVIVYSVPSSLSGTIFIFTNSLTSTSTVSPHLFVIPVTIIMLVALGFAVQVPVTPPEIL